MIFPSAFVKSTKEILKNEYPLFEKAMLSEVPVSIRINDKIDFNTATFNNVKWCKSGFYLDKRPIFTSDPLFHAGAYYVQEAASMFVYQAVKQHFTDVKTILDLCAAPGGKSTLLLQFAKKDNLLISNEIIPSRAKILYENITKWGNANVIVTNNKPSDFQKFSNYFDAILVDAPCSGEGMFRKDATAINEWSERAVVQCAARQRNIVKEIWNSLKNNGLLIYSTCTFNRTENEENVHWICENLGAEMLKINISDFPEITETDGGYRFFPHKIKGEGFFMSVLKKNNLYSNSLKIKSKTNIFKNVKLSDFTNLKLKENDFTFFDINNKIIACPSTRKEDFAFIFENLKSLSIGLEIGEKKLKDFVFSHAVAMSKNIDTQSVNAIDIDYQTAILFLRKENFQIQKNILGYNLLCFRQVPLGWIKNIGNRHNNLYPNEWRIRMNINDLYYNQVLPLMKEN